MNVKIDKNTLPLIQEELAHSSMPAIRIKKAACGCGGLYVEIVPDQMADEDETVFNSNIPIIADKSISFYFDNALITHKETSEGYRFKLKTQ